MHRSLVMKLLIDLHYITRYTINMNLPYSTRHAVTIRQGHSRLQGEASIIRLPLLLNAKLRYAVPSRIQSDPMQNDSPLRWPSFPSSLPHLLANLALCLLYHLSRGCHFPKGSSSSHPSVYPLFDHFFPSRWILRLTFLQRTLRHPL